MNKCFIAFAMLASCKKEYSCEECFTKPDSRKLISVIDNYGSNATVTGVWFNRAIDSSNILPGHRFADSVSFTSDDNMFYVTTKCANPLISNLTRVVVANGPSISDTTLVYTSATNTQIAIGHCFEDDITVTISKK